MNGRTLKAFRVPQGTNRLEVKLATSEIITVEISDEDILKLALLSTFNLEVEILRELLAGQDVIVNDYAS